MEDGLDTQKSLSRLKRVTQESKVMLMRLKNDVEWSEKNRGVNSVEHKKRLYYHAQMMGQVNATASVVASLLNELRQTTLEKDSYFICYNRPKTGLAKFALDNDWPDHMIDAAKHIDELNELTNKAISAIDYKLKMQGEVLRSSLNVRDPKQPPKDWPQSFNKLQEESNHWFQVFQDSINND